METLQVIAQRRSIRRFKDKPVVDEIIDQVLHAATLAPSGKNRQPWRFIVVKGDRRAEMVRVMRQGIERLKAQGESTGSSMGTARIMEEAPVTVFVFNPYEENFARDQEAVNIWWNVIDVQSVGAAIQNMLLAALDLGLASLWICDVFYAYDELSDWLGETHQMIAAVALGYPDEQPEARPRLTVDEVTRWL